MKFKKPKFWDYKRPNLLSYLLLPLTLPILIKNTFFKKSINYKGTFLNGAFTNQIFNLIEKEKNKIKVFVGDIKISISDKSNFNYSAL